MWSNTTVLEKESTIFSNRFFSLYNLGGKSILADFYIPFYCKTYFFKISLNDPDRQPVCSSGIFFATKNQKWLIFFSLKEKVKITARPPGFTTR